MEASVSGSASGVIASAGSSGELGVQPLVASVSAGMAEQVAGEPPSQPVEQRASLLEVALAAVPASTAAASTKMAFTRETLHEEAVWAAALARLVPQEIRSMVDVSAVAAAEYQDCKKQWMQQVSRGQITCSLGQFFFLTG